MRLRLVSVERNECGQCGKRFEGDRCTRCDAPFAAGEGRKNDDDRLILADVHPPIYRRSERCRCPECRNLYEITRREVELHITCTCGASFLSTRGRLQLIATPRRSKSFLQAARRLVNVLAAVRECPNGHRLPHWCPWCRAHAPQSTANGLPETPTMVWERTGFIKAPIVGWSTDDRDGGDEAIS